MIVVANHLGASGDLPQATNDFDRAETDGPSELVSQRLGASEVAGILGLIYGFNTYVTELAAGLPLAGEVGSLGLRVIAFDSERRIPYCTILATASRRSYRQESAGRHLW